LDFEKFNWSNYGLNCKKLKVSLPIKGLNEEIQNQESNRKICETSRVEIDQIRG
jgi:hypothetical protein